LQSARTRRAGGLDRFVTALATVLARLNDPADSAAQLMVAAVLLAFEGVLCLLIIRRVPCGCCRLSARCLSPARLCAAAGPRPVQGHQAVLLHQSASGLLQTPR
jgi:hypothetical protein